MGDEALATVPEPRSDIIPQPFSEAEAEVLVTGGAAWHVDFFDEIARYMPIALTVVLGLTFILLMVVFRSPVIPMKAILMRGQALADVTGGRGQRVARGEPGSQGRDAGGSRYG